MTTKEIAVAISYDPPTDIIAITGRRRPWGPRSREFEESRREVIGWAPYTHLVTMRDTLAWEDSRYFLVGPR